MIITHFLVFTMIFFNRDQQPYDQIIEKNGMTVPWSIKNQRMFMEMNAPTDGWVAIGINTKNTIDKAYLVMGRIKYNQVEAIEHFTDSPGFYNSFDNLEEETTIEDIKGIYHKGHTNIRFSIPLHSSVKYTKSIHSGKFYFLTLAYSREKDFQHHSIMRTSVKVKFY